MANPTLLSRLLCADADKNTIPDTDAGTAGVFSQQYGWQAINSLPLSAGGKAVQRQDFNGVFNLLGGIAFYAQKGWQFEFDETQNYFAGCIVRDTVDGKLYECLNDVSASSTHPNADSTNWKEFGTDTTTLANTDLSNLTATGLNAFADKDLSNLTQTGQDSFLNRDFTIIYPNGGTETNPAGLAVSTRYVEQNPYAGYYVAVSLELYFNNVWATAIGFSPFPSSGSGGASCGQYGNDNIVIQTSRGGWQVSTSDGSARNGDLFGTTNSIPITTPCRVKVWKIGKIPT